MESIEIVPLNLAWLEQALEIEKQCFPDPWSWQSMEDQINIVGGMNLAAVAGGRLAGYVGAHAILDEGYIDNLAVDPSYRRQGVAVRLLAALEGLAREKGVETLTLEVRPSNAPAQALYGRRGFVPVGRRKNYYLHPKEDAILMTLELKRS